MLKEEVTFGVGLMNGLPNGGWFAGLVEEYSSLAVGHAKGFARQRGKQNNELRIHSVP